MHRISFFLGLVALLFTQSAFGQSRHADSHEHGKGTLNIAIEGKLILMELEAPGADIVGFEHPAKSVTDRNAIKNAKAVLSKADQIFTLPKSAGCDLERAEVDLLREELSGDDAANHTEFFAMYQFGCADPDKFSEFGLPYFRVFPNAQELSIQLITRQGSARYDVGRNSATVKIGVGG